MTEPGEAAAGPPEPEKPWQEQEEDRRKADASGVGLRVTADGKVYEVHLGEMSGLDVKIFREETGLSTSRLLNTVLDGDADVDTLAAVMWLARYIAGERRLRYVEVAGGMKWGMAGRSIRFVEAVPNPPAPVRDEATGESDHPEV